MKRIEPLAKIDYNQPFVSNELNKRNFDQASLIVDKINEIIEAVNWYREFADILASNLGDSTNTEKKEQ